MIKTTIRLLRIIFAFFALWAITFDALHVPDVVHYFSSFTVISNIFASVLFLYLAHSPKAENSRISSIRGATVAYVLLTAAVYALLLQKTEGPVAYPWVNFVIHKLMPSVVTLDWLASPPANKLKITNSLNWLIFPLIYLAYTLIRGPFINWYPYYFLDPTKIGYFNVAVYFLIIFPSAWVASLGIIFVGNKLRYFHYKFAA